MTGPLFSRPANEVIFNILPQSYLSNLMTANKVIGSGIASSNLDYPGFIELDCSQFAFEGVFMTELYPWQGQGQGGA